ncbi:MAG: KpsF/GutQ family sugar-phosphate isomerase [Bernardetiaceae bacterium]|nr:KpsF/GutQ family sugar-phosphate isomerase [Bernardetiaceae bacterium]
MLPTSYAHYATACDTFEAQMQALVQALGQIAPLFDKTINTLLTTEGKVVVTGVGKSGIIAHKISATLASTGTPSVYLNASEALHGDLGMVSQGDAILMLSKSGTTLELMRMLPTLEKIGVQTIGIFGNTNTNLAQNLDICLDASIEREACPLNLAPMSSTTVALVIGDAIAATLMKARNFRSDDFALFHPAGQLGRNLLLRVSDVMHKNKAKAKPEDSLKTLLINMTQHNLGAVCICDKHNKLMGIITDGDVRRALIQNPDLDMKATMLMTRNPTCLSPNMKLAEVMSIMENPQKQIYIAPVIDEDEQYLGLVRMHDILQNYG